MSCLMNVEKFLNKAQLNIGSASNFWGSICLYIDLFRNTPMKSSPFNDKAECNCN